VAGRVVRIVLAVVLVAGAVTVIVVGVRLTFAPAGHARGRGPLPMCRGRDLEVGRMGRQSAAGRVTRWLRVTDRAAHGCSLAGLQVTRLVGVTADGTRGRIGFVRASPAEAGMTRVASLGPGGSAEVALITPRDPSCEGSEVYVGLRLTLAGARRSVARRGLAMEVGCSGTPIVTGFGRRGP
jgi:hypothetical protein